MARRPEAVIEFEGDTVLIHIPKALVVMTRREFIVALRRGKAWQRRKAWEARREGADDGTRA